MNLQEHCKGMYAKGYRFCIVFAESSGLMPLCVKTLAEIGPLMREQYPKEKNYRGFEFDENGQEIDKRIK